MLDLLPQPETFKVPPGLPLGPVTRNLKQGRLLLAVLSLAQTPTGKLLNSLRKPNLVARVRPVVPHETVITAKGNLLRLRVHAA
jgi:hypothetical protein